MNVEKRKRITCRINFVPTWDEYINPDPREDVKTIVRQNEELKIRKENVVRELEEHGGSEVFPLISKISQEFPERKTTAVKGGGWKWYDARYMITTAIGAPEPEWDGKTRSWWMDREKGAPFSQFSSADEIRRVPIPDWRSLPQVRKMLESRERWKMTFPDDPVEFANVGYRLSKDGRSMRSAGYPSFVDMGMFLIGTTRFFTELGLQSDLAEALMDKCFELSTSYVEFLRSIENGHGGLQYLIGFAGDATCMLSPELYDRYSASWDARLFEFISENESASADLPCNLHSCGPSAHLYEKWGEHPYRDNIRSMQTRFIPGQVGRLRKNLPTTRLDLTIHPQHFDVAQVAAEELHRVLSKATEGAGSEDLHYTVLVAAHKPEAAEPIQKNLEVLYRILLEFNT